MNETPKRRRRVERIEDWDEARYSVIPPRAALDLRLTLVHFRVMAYLGRVNTQEGWCELSQTAVAEAWQLARQTVNIAVRELVAWGYLQTRGQQETRSARCHYRVLIDEPEPEEAQGDVSSTGDTPQEGTCHLQVTPVSSPEVTPVSPIKDTPLDQRSEITPPKPPEGGGGGGIDFRVDWVEELRAEGCAAVVLDHLLLPLLAAGLKPWKDVDPRSPARQLCEDFRRRSAPVLRAAASTLLDTHRHRLPPVASARAAVKAEGDKAALTAMRERAVAAAEPEMQRFDRGTPEYAAELARWQREDPGYARTIERRGFVRLKVEPGRVA